MIACCLKQNGSFSSDKPVSRSHSRNSSGGKLSLAEKRQTLAAKRQSSQLLEAAAKAVLGAGSEEGERVAADVTTSVSSPESVQMEEINDDNYAAEKLPVVRVRGTSFAPIFVDNNDRPIAPPPLPPRQLSMKSEDGQKKVRVKNIAFAPVAQHIVDHPLATQDPLATKSASSEFMALASIVEEALPETIDQVQNRVCSVLRQWKCWNCCLILRHRRVF